MSAERPDPADLATLRDNLVRVLAGLRWPAYRWEVIAEAEAWGVTGVIHNQLVPLPDGRYPSVEAVVHALAGARRRPVPERPVHPIGRAAPPRPPVSYRLVSERTAPQRYLPARTGTGLIGPRARPTGRA